MVCSVPVWLILDGSFLGSPFLPVDDVRFMVCIQGCQPN